MKLEYNYVLSSMRPSASMKGLDEKQYLFNLAVGSPDISPPDQIAQLLKDFSANPLYNYQPVKGSLNALNNLKKLVDPDNNHTDPSQNLLLVPGAKYGIYLSLKTICNPGDTVLIIEPYWLSYPDICHSLHVNFVTWKINKESQSYDIISFKKILKSTKLKAIIINNPVNPSGYVFGIEFLNELIQECKQKDIWIILDEVYKELCFKEDVVLHCNLNAENLIKIGSLSKSLCIPGFRAGYVNAPVQFIQQFNLLHQHIATSIHALTNFIVSSISPSVYNSFTRNCAAVYFERYEIAKLILEQKGFKVLESKASFYLMVDVSHRFDDGEKACAFYEQQNIIMTPGVHYGDSYSSYVRLCLTLPKDQLFEVISLL